MGSKKSWRQKLADSNSQFVIQKHSKPNSTHWDLMLRSGNCLKTYRINLEPEKLLHECAEAENISDHDLKFLTYEGPLTNDKGTVEIADQGSYTITNSDETEIKLHFDGKILKGDFSLKHVKTNKWLFESIFLI